MSYDECGGCDRIKHFSNPNVSFSGQTTGTSGTHNNARVLNETAFAVSRFMRPPEVIIDGPTVVGRNANCTWHAVHIGGTSPTTYMNGSVSLKVTGRQFRAQLPVMVVISSSMHMTAGGTLAGNG